MKETLWIKTGRRVYTHIGGLVTINPATHDVLRYDILLFKGGFRRVCGSQYLTEAKKLAERALQGLPEQCKDCKKLEDCEVWCIASLATCAMKELKQ